MCDRLRNITFKFICYRNTSCNNIRNICKFQTWRPTSRQRVFSLSKKLCFSAMTDQLEGKKATRRENRAVITKYGNEAKELLANGENIDENTKDRLNTLHDLLEEKLQVVKKFDEENLQLCEVKEIENDIEVSKEFNSRVLDVKRQISKFFAKKIDDTGKVPIHDISIPGQNTPQVEITEVGEFSAEINVNN